VLDRQHRVGGAELRAQRARQELEAFTAANARALLEEREETARGVTAELTRAVAAMVRAHRAYLARLRSGRDGGWRACLPNRATRP
jgi:hypothetical protein